MPIEYKDPILAYLARNKSEGEEIKSFLDTEGIPSIVDDLTKMVKDPGWYAFFLSTYRPRVMVLDMNAPMRAAYRDYHELRDNDSEHKQRAVLLRTPAVDGLRTFLAFQDLGHAAIIDYDRKLLVDHAKIHLSDSNLSSIPYPDYEEQPDYPPVDPGLYRLLSI